MRKIEENMLNAVKARRNWSEGNTRVHWVPGLLEGEVKLHGNTIAYISYDTGRVTVDIDTLARWPTVTTLSRLRALGVDVRKHKGEILIDGRPI